MNALVADFLRFCCHTVKPRFRLLLRTALSQLGSCTIVPHSGILPTSDSENHRMAESSPAFIPSRGLWSRFRRSWLGPLLSPAFTEVPATPQNRWAQMNPYAGEWSARRSLGGECELELFRCAWG